MTLYEMIVLAKASTAKSTTGLVQILSSQILEKGGNVRNATVLGDRILNRALKGNDDKKHIVGRYLQILYDGNPAMHNALEKAARESNDGLRAKTFRVNDFYNDAQLFKRTLKYTSPIYPEHLRDKNYLHQLQHLAKLNHK